MKEISYRSIIFLILASLVILILSQGWLLQKQYQYTEEIFQDKVSNLLFELKERIEKSITPDKRKPFENSYYLKLNEEHKSFYAQFVVIEDYVHPKSIDYTIDDQLAQQRQLQIKQLFEELLATSPGIDTLERVIVEYTQGKNTASEETNSTDYIAIEVVLKELMEEFHIHTPYEFGIKDILQNKWISHTFQADTIGLINSNYTTQIFSETEQFFLTFPKKSDFFLRQLTFYIWVTLSVILFVLSVFWYILSVVFKQKNLSELKTDFINNMTHEFKTPIATIAFATANIENKKVIKKPEDILKFTEVIKKENKRMNRQVEQVLQAAILDRRALNMSLEPVDIHDVIHQIADTVAIKITSRKGTLIRELNANHHIIQGDRTHLTNVIANLLDNAQKYSPNQPKVTVTTTNSNNHIHISVTDKGKGLSEEEKEKVFDKFYRVPTGNLHNVKGFGLGLSYSKAIVERHGGQISLKSKLHKGSTFTIALPIR